MDTLQVLTLAIVQALTEFLPISSSAHLFLAAELFGWSYQGVLFDLGLHLGTLAAVLVYYRQQWLRMGCAAIAWRPGVTLDPDQRLLWLLGIATLPAAVAALVMTQFDGLALAMRRHEVIAATQIGFGLLLWWAWQRGKVDGRDEYQLDTKIVLIIGFAQALALVPGTSRSGICITAALFLGMARPAAARFAFLMAVPIIGLGALHAAKELFEGGDGTPLSTFFLGMIASAIAGLACIALFLRILSKIGMTPFLIYRLGLGALLIWLSFSGLRAE